MVVHWPSRMLGLSPCALLLFECAAVVVYREKRHIDNERSKFDALYMLASPQ